MYNDSIESSFGRLLAYNTREKRKFEFWWTKPLRNKKSRKAADDQEFQIELLRQMKRHSQKGPFTGPVILELQYSVESRQSPAIHTLTKRRIIDLTKTKNGSPRIVHLNADAMTAITSMKESGQHSTDLVFPRAGTKKSFDNRSWFRT